jgi:hypothetical protein
MSDLGGGDVQMDSAFFLKADEPLAKLPKLEARSAFLASAERLCRWMLLPDAVNPAIWTQLWR